MDFYCPSRSLVVEVDGAVHDARPDADDARDARLTALGFRVLRVSNEDVLGDLNAVVLAVMAALEGR